MKKLLSGAFVLLALAFGFTACDDDDDFNDNQIHSTLPEQVTAGTYSGTWTRVQSGKTDTTTAVGTLTFEAVDTAKYVTRVSAECKDFKVDVTEAANISWVNDVFAFSNMNSTNAFGSTFYGNITSTGVATIKFSLKQRAGLKTSIFYYTFEGTKQ